jgi:hypothetical protein
MRHLFDSARLTLTVGVALPAVALASTLVLASPASARTPGVTCKVLTGDVSVGTLSSCNHAKQTGGGGSWPEASGTSTITWSSGKTTVVSQTATLVTSGDEKEGKTKVCPSGSAEYNIAGTVTADTTGVIPVGSEISAEVCLDFSVFTVINEPGSKFKV